MKFGLALATVVLAAVHVGCEVEDPYAATEAPESPIAVDAPPADPAATPTAALRSVALASGNWTSEDARAGFERARRVTVGGARVALRRQARQILRGLKVAPSPVRAELTIEGIVVRGSGARRNAIVITREQMTGVGVEGEGPAYVVTLATVERTRGGWAISRWEPQA